MPTCDVRRAAVAAGAAGRARDYAFIAASTRSGSSGE